MKEKHTLVLSARGFNEIVVQLEGMGKELTELWKICLHSNRTD
jgi:hypothetical protein